MNIGIVWACLAAAYLFFAGEISVEEGVAALLAGSLGAAWTVAVRRASPHAFRFDAACLAACGRAIAGLPGATAEVGRRFLSGAARGRIVVRPFVRGPRDRPEERARRAVATLAVSLSPDSFALRLPDREDRMELHCLADEPSMSDSRWPI